MTAARFFLLPAARSASGSPHLEALLRILNLEGLDAVHGRDFAEVEASAGARPYVLAVLEGLIVDLGYGFVAQADWGPAWTDPLQPETGSEHSTRPLAEFRLSVRAWNCLDRAGIRTVAELASRTEGQLLEERNLGRKTLKELKELLGTMGLSLQPGLGGATLEDQRGGAEGQRSPFEAWPVSSVTRERLRIAGVTTSADLERVHERTLLDAGVPLVEVLALSEMLSEVADTTFAPVDRSLARLRINLNLLVRIGQLGYPERALAQVPGIGVDGRLWQAAALTRKQLGESMDPKLIDAASRLLATCGVETGAVLDPRFISHASELADMFGAELAQPAVLRPRFVEDEIHALLGGAPKERSASIAIRSMGWGRDGRVRDVAVAQDLQVSRERIRQIREQALRRFRAPGVGAPRIEAATEFIRQRVPEWAGRLESELVDAGICRGEIRLEGLLSAAYERGIPNTPTVVEEADFRLAINEHDAAQVRSLLRTTRRRVGAMGEAAACAMCIAELKGEPILAPAASAATPAGTAELVIEGGNGLPQGNGEPAVAEAAFPQEGSTEEIATWLLQAARDQGRFPAQEPWSLAELSWSPRLSEGLRRWGREGSLGSSWELSRPFLLAGERMSGREAAAAVFLAYSAEIGRREAHEGDLWPAVRRGLGPGLQDRLFTEGGMLRAWMRDALEWVCPRLGLRHVFGQEGVQSWIRTVFLQFGVSNSGWERLPWWLSGHPTSVTVQDLLAGPDSLRSPSFGALWKVLVRARSGHKDGVRLLRELRQLECPWVFADVVEQVAGYALARPDIAAVPNQESSSQDQETSSGVFAEPRLEWRPGAAPAFALDLAPEPPDGTGTGPWTLHVEGAGRHNLVPDQQGKWRVQGLPITVEPRAASVRFDLSERGARVLDDELALVDPDEEIILLDLRSGRQLDAWAPISPPGRPVAILARSDLKLTPEPPEWVAVFGGAWKLWGCRAGVPVGTTAVLGEEEIWRSSHSEVRARVPRGRAWCLESARWGDSIRLRVEVEEGEPVILRLGSSLHPVDQNGGTYQARVTVDRSIRRSTLARVVVLRHGRRTTWPIDLQVDPFWGAAREAARGAWIPVQPNEHLDASDVDGHGLVVEPPAGWRVNPDELALLEGHTFQRRPKGPVRDLGSTLHGLGAPLVLCRGPYNRIGDTQASLCEAVVGSGLVRSADRPVERSVRLQLRAAIDASADHRLWTWRHGDSSPTPIGTNRTSWRQSECWVSEEPEHAFACAVEYRGAWLGARSVAPLGPDAFGSALEEAGNWAESALWLRWWRAPLLLQPLRALIEKRALARPVETLTAWLGNPVGLPAPMHVEADDPAWATVVRAYFWNWLPSGDEAAALLRATGMLTGDLDADLRKGWEDVEPLLAVHPSLLASVARLGVPAVFPSARGANRSALLQKLRNRIVGLDDGAETAEWVSAKAELLSQAADLMNVDRNFIAPGLMQEARALANGATPQHDNLRVALVIGPLRKFIAASLVHEFAEAAS